MVEVEETGGGHGKSDVGVERAKSNCRLEL